MKKLPDYINNKRSNTIERYSSCLLKSIKKGDMFFAEHLYTYLDNFQQKLCLDILIKKGYNTTHEEMLNISKKQK